MIRRTANSGTEAPVQQDQRAPAAELRLRARRIITPAGERDGVVVARAGVITEVASAEAATGAETLVPDDCVLLPGLVDSHVHVNEPGRTQWEGFATATAAAAAGGITTIADMPLNSIPPTVDVTSLAVKRAAAHGQLSADVAFWGGAVPGNAADLRRAARGGRRSGSSASCCRRACRSSRRWTPPDCWPR